VKTNKKMISENDVIVVDDLIFDEFGAWIAENSLDIAAGNAAQKFLSIVNFTFGGSLMKGEAKILVDYDQRISNAFDGTALTVEKFQAVLRSEINKRLPGVEGVEVTDITLLINAYAHAYDRFHNALHDQSLSSKILRLFFEVKPRTVEHSIFGVVCAIGIYLDHLREKDVITTLDRYQATLDTANSFVFMSEQRRDSEVKSFLNVMMSELDFGRRWIRVIKPEDDTPTMGL
jgi:hypothetical protein